MATRKRSTSKSDPSATSTPAPADASTQAAALAAQTAANKTKFLQAYASTGNVSAAATLANVGRRTHYDWLQDDTEYAALFADAVDESADALETEARRRALEGVMQPVYGSLGGGEGTGEVGAIVKYSDTLLIFLLKGARPEKYAERQKHTHTGKVTLEQVLDASRSDGA